MRARRSAPLLPLVALALIAAAIVAWRSGAVWGIVAFPLALVAVLAGWLLVLVAGRTLEHLVRRRRNAVIFECTCGRRQRYREGWICRGCGADHLPRE